RPLVEVVLLPVLVHRLRAHDELPFLGVQRILRQLDPQRNQLRHDDPALPRVLRQPDGLGCVEAHVARLAVEVTRWATTTSAPSWPSGTIFSLIRAQRLL